MKAFTLFHNQLQNAKTMSTSINFRPNPNAALIQVLEACGITYKTASADDNTVVELGGKPVLVQVTDMQLLIRDPRSINRKINGGYYAFDRDYILRNSHIARMTQKLTEFIGRI